MLFLKLKDLPCNPQCESVLFNKVPGEIRNRIFAYALEDFEDLSKEYDEQTCYRRPNYMAPRRSSISLLQTCKQIYLEAWFRPWVSAEHTFYLTAEDRRPTRTTTVKQMKTMLTQLHDLDVERFPEDQRDIEVNHIRVFSQLYMLEPGTELGKILTLPHLAPRTVTITLRHADWWYWETDMPLRINAEWVNRCVFPPSTREIRMELESLERKKNQIDWIAGQMRERWQFRRADGVMMGAQRKEEPEIARWSGSSTWGGYRWIRDETRPETLDYYVLTVTWRPLPKDFNQEEETIKTQFHNPHLQFNGTPISGIGAQQTGMVPVSALSAAKVPKGTPGPEALKIVAKWRRAGPSLLSRILP